MSILGGILSGIVGRPAKLALPTTPEYQVDPNFTGTQSFLKNYSENILQGNIPDFYKSIGMTADQAAGEGLMNDYVKQASSDVINNDLQSGALTGRGRTGISSDALNQAANISGQLRYADYARAMQGKEDLLGLGYTGETGVRANALTNMNQQNSFDQWKYNSDVNSQRMTNASANARRQHNADAINSVDNSLTQMAASLFGGGGGMAGLSAFNPSGFSAMSSPYNSTSMSGPDVNSMKFGNIVSRSNSGTGNSQLDMILKTILGSGLAA